MCEMTFVKYACGYKGRRLDRHKCECITQADKLLEQGAPIYDKEIIKFEKLCEELYIIVEYSYRYK
jgi:hypothetical protein